MTSRETIKEQEGGDDQQCRPGPRAAAAASLRVSSPERQPAAPLPRLELPVLQPLVQSVHLLAQVAQLLSQLLQAGAGRVAHQGVVENHT